MFNLRTKIAGVALGAAMMCGAGVVLAQPAEAQQDRAEQRELRMQQREQRLQERVDDGTITQERADEIRARIAERLARHEERVANRQARLDDLAATLNTTADELKADLRAGVSLSEIAAAAGVDVNVIIDQIEAQKTARINEAVANGRIDQARADEKLEGLRDHITDRVNGERPERPGRRGHGPRGGN